MFLIYMQGGSFRMVTLFAHGVESVYKPYTNP